MSRSPRKGAFLQDIYIYSCMPQSIILTDHIYILYVFMYIYNIYLYIYLYTYIYITWKYVYLQIYFIRLSPAPPLWRQPRAASMGGCLEARQAGNPRVENDFPPGKRVSHHGKSCPTVPPPLLTLHFRPYLSRIQDPGYWILVPGSCIRHPGSRIHGNHTLFHSEIQPAFVI